jgi:hypothetical protein
MSRCARCTETREWTAEIPAASFTLCPEHALAVLENIRRQLATTLASLERATDRASDIVGSAASV